MVNLWANPYGGFLENVYRGGAVGLLGYGALRGADVIADHIAEQFSPSASVYDEDDEEYMNFELPKTKKKKRIIKKIQEKSANLNKQAQDDNRYFIGKTDNPGFMDQVFKNYGYGVGIGLGALGGSYLVNRMIRPPVNAMRLRGLLNSYEDAHQEDVELNRRKRLLREENYAALGLDKQSSFEQDPVINDFADKLYDESMRNLDKVASVVKEAQDATGSTAAGAASSDDSSFMGNLGGFIGGLGRGYFYELPTKILPPLYGLGAVAGGVLGYNYGRSLTNPEYDYTNEMNKKTLVNPPKMVYQFGETAYVDPDDEYIKAKKRSKTRGANVVLKEAMEQADLKKKEAYDLTANFTNKPHKPPKPVVKPTSTISQISSKSPVRGSISDSVSKMNIRSKINPTGQLLYKASQYDSAGHSGGIGNILKKKRKSLYQPGSATASNSRFGNQNPPGGIGGQSRLSQMMNDKKRDWQTRDMKQPVDKMPTMNDDQEAENPILGAVREGLGNVTATDVAKQVASDTYQGGLNVVEDITSAGGKGINKTVVDPGIKKLEKSVTDMSKQIRTTGTEMQKELQQTFKNMLGEARQGAAGIGSRFTKGSIEGILGGLTSMKGLGGMALMGATMGLGPVALMSLMNRGGGNQQRGGNYNAPNMGYAPNPYAQFGLPPRPRISNNQRSWSG